MIAEPLNDSECLGQLTRLAAAAAERRDVRQLVARFPDTAALAAWIRSLPQRYDAGNPEDGPRVTCDVSQRARVMPSDPNCVERSLLYLAAAEVLDPEAVRQLATIDTGAGRHTFPIEDGRPVLLDPAMPRNALRAGVFLMTTPSTIPDEPPDPRELLPWLADIAADQVDDERGRARVRRGRAAFDRLLARRPLNEGDYAAISYTLDRADEAVRHADERAMPAVLKIAIGRSGEQFALVGLHARSEKLDAARRRADGGAFVGRRACSLRQGGARRQDRGGEGGNE